MYVDLSILSPQSGYAPRQMMERVALLCEAIPHLTPNKWGFYEPLKNRFDPNDLTSLVPEDGVCKDIFWKTKKSSGSFWVAKKNSLGNVHSSVDLRFEIGAVPEKELLQYFKQTALVTCADFGFIDIWAEQDRQFGILNESAKYNKYYIVTHTLRKWLPNVFWAMVFGKPYIQMIGKERLLSVPTYTTKLLSNGLIFVQLTESITDIVRQREKVMAVRKQAVSHIGSQYFFDPKRPDVPSPCAPTFEPEVEIGKPASSG